MEVSSSVNSRVSSTDFSIDRILSCETRDSANAASAVGLTKPEALVPETTPTWLFCTRYQPPRIPRGASSTVRGRSRRAGRHARVPFTSAQSTALEAAFHRAAYLAPPALRALAHALQLREDRIKIWFQNRRARERREKSNFAFPPPAVSIPPTSAHIRPDSGRTSQSSMLAKFIAPSCSVKTLLNRSIDTQETKRRRFDQEQLTRGSPSDKYYGVHEQRTESPVDVETFEDE